MRKLTSTNSAEYETHKFCAEASTLGIKPGHVPLTIDTDLGNGRPFLLQHNYEQFFDYRQEEGYIILRVFND